MASSKRMTTILEFIRPGCPLYDLCCDHGLIGLQGLEPNRSSFVTFIDQSERALSALKLSVSALSPELRLKTRIVCAAAESCTIEARNADVIVAGVGVHTIIEIVDKLFPDSLGDHRLILAPQQKSQPLREYLRQRDFRLVDEKVVKEKGRFREIIVVEQTGFPIDLYGTRYAERQDPDSQAFVHYLKSYYESLPKPRL